jgi:hypothetical protein
MKKIVGLAMLLRLPASTAMAQSGLNLNASSTPTTADCYSGGTSLHAVVNTCTSNSGTAFNVLASVVPAGDDPDFIGAATILDLQSGAASLPAWWSVDAAGCRPGAVVATQDATIDTSSAAWTRYTSPAGPGSNVVTYNAGCPAATPALNRTWGSVKALYR